jgi:hypothetical protein
MAEMTESVRGNGDTGSTLVPAGPTLPINLYGTAWLTALGDKFAVVIDTSVITTDVIKASRAGLPSPLFLAMRTGLVRGFMAHHTWAEVPRVLAKRCPHEGVDPAVAEALWWRDYVKIIRFVSTAGLPSPDPALERALDLRDKSDLPTLVLASLIAPTVVLAADADLKDIGLAYERWWEVPAAVRKMVAGRGSAEFAARAVFGAGYGAILGIRGAVRLARKPAVAGTLVVLLGLAAATRRYWEPALRAKIEKWQPETRDLLGTMWRATSRVFEEYGAAFTIWTSAQRGKCGRTLIHRVARILATCPSPMTRTEILKHLTGDVSDPSHRDMMYELYAALRSHRAFHEPTRGRWQLGKENANFGGLVPLPRTEARGSAPATNGASASAR